MSKSKITFYQPTSRRFGLLNWLGLWALYLKEVRRFLNVSTQTLFAPVVSALLFYAIFALATGHQTVVVADISYAVFLPPGLMMMSMVQNAFANTSSSLILSKMQGNVVDILMPPLRPAELTIALAAGGITRGLLVGLMVGLFLWLLTPLSIHHAIYILFYGTVASLILSLLGIISGLIAQKYDHLAALTNFIVTPLAFLSGTFYSIHQLPTFWQQVAHANPFFYMIDGFRYGFTNHADGPLWLGIVVLCGTSVALTLIVYRLFHSGYRLKG
ncbi:MAG TPA: ABC transporter permease [Alphaproteobacteria bacterium]|nr:ABC transporter permease [Alphaproteobacteria bacterium]